MTDWLLNQFDEIRAIAVLYIDKICLDVASCPGNQKHRWWTRKIPMAMLLDPKDEILISELQEPSIAQSYQSRPGRHRSTAQTKPLKLLRTDCCRTGYIFYKTASFLNQVKTSSDSRIRWMHDEINESQSLNHATTRRRKQEPCYGSEKISEDE
jgi:hypothetical protein